MSGLGTSAISEELIALKERKRLLDDVWMLTLMVLFVAVGVPWYLRALDIDFAPVAWSLFGYGVLYVLSTFAADKIGSERRLMSLIRMIQATGIIFLGFIWHLSGNLQNPMFLLVFVLPIVAGSLILASWQSFINVCLSIITVSMIALLDGPELRWYATQTGPWAKRFIELIPASSMTKQNPFPSLNSPPSYFFVLLILFTVL